MATSKWPMLHLELSSSVDLNFKLRGSGPEVSAMVVTAMIEDSDAAAIFLSAAVLFCKEKGISLGNLDGISNATL